MAQCAIVHANRPEYDLVECIDLSGQYYRDSSSQQFVEIEICDNFGVCKEPIIATYVPEPAAALLIAAGILGLVILKRMEGARCSIAKATNTS